MPILESKNKTRRTKNQIPRATKITCEAELSISWSVVLKIVCSWIQTDVPVKKEVQDVTEYIEPVPKTILW